MSHLYSVRRGFSLVETLISAALVLLVLGLGARFLIPLMRMQVLGSERVEMQQRSTILLEDLRRDLATTTAAGVSLAQSPNEVLLAIHQADNVAQDGTLVWKDSLLVHHWSSADQLWKRSQWKDPSRRLLRATAPTRLSEQSLRELLDQGSLLRVSAGVSAAKLEHPDGASVIGNLPLLARLSFTTPGGETRQVVRTLGGRLPSL